jgi:hypothetical protein
MVEEEEVIDKKTMFEIVDEISCDDANASLGLNELSNISSNH